MLSPPQAETIWPLCLMHWSLSAVRRTLMYLCAYILVHLCTFQLFFLAFTDNNDDNFFIVVQ